MIDVSPVPLIFAAIVVGGIGATDCHRHEVFDQPFDIGLPSAVPSLPARHDVLDLCVQEFQKIDVLGLHEL